MATKKTTKTDKTKKATKAEAAPPVEQTDAAAATPTPAKSKAKKAKAPKKPKAKKTSALDAAFRVLEEAGQPMTCPEMFEAMTRKGYWTSPGGKTPAVTLYSAILQGTQTKGDASMRAKMAGKFKRIATGKSRNPWKALLRR
jgi:hypothetical protein